MRPILLHLVSLLSAKHIAMIIRSFPSLGILALTALYTVAATTSGVLAEGAALPSAELTSSRSATFSQQSGEALFVNACQACHMEEGKGAVGAGTYPPLANNSNLEDGS